MAVIQESVTTPGPFQKLGRWLWNTKELLLTLTGIVVFWIVIIEVRDFHRIVLPPPGEVVAALRANLSEYASAGFITFYEMIFGFMAGGALGFFSAIGIFYSPFLRRSLYPLLLGFRIVPKVAFVPLFLVWFGIGIGVKVALASFAIFFLILVQTLLGLTSVEPELVELGRSLKMNEPSLLRRIRLPAALPAIMVGVKLGITYALTNVVVAEMVVATNGLGFLVVDARSKIKTDEMIAAIVVVAFIGLMVYAVGLWVERKAVFWYMEEAQ
ncbi:MAG: ABC transporter permease [Acidimicrobiia bacterium]|nr:ABC transporter permease [Acidimicrobiia bacterium]